MASDMLLGYRKDAWPARIDWKPHKNLIRLWMVNFVRASHIIRCPASSATVLCRDFEWDLSGTHADGLPFETMFLRRLQSQMRNLWPDIEAVLQRQDPLPAQAQRAVTRELTRVLATNNVTQTANNMNNAGEQRNVYDVRRRTSADLQVLSPPQGPVLRSAASASTTPVNPPAPAPAPAPATAPATATATAPTKIPASADLSQISPGHTDNEFESRRPRTRQSQRLKSRVEHEKRSGHAVDDLGSNQALKGLLNKPQSPFSMLNDATELFYNSIIRRFSSAASKNSPKYHLLCARTEAFEPRLAHLQSSFDRLHRRTFPMLTPAKVESISDRPTRGPGSDYTQYEATPSPQPPSPIDTPTSTRAATPTVPRLQEHNPSPTSGTIDQFSSGNFTIQGSSSDINDASATPNLLSQNITDASIETSYPTSPASDAPTVTAASDYDTYASKRSAAPTPLTSEVHSTAPLRFSTHSDTANQDLTHLPEDTESDQIKNIPGPPQVIHQHIPTHKVRCNARTLKNVRCKRMVTIEATSENPGTDVFCAVHKHNLNIDALNSDQRLEEHLLTSIEQESKYGFGRDLVNGIRDAGDHSDTDSQGPDESKPLLAN